jgi:hypothetical protein
MGMTPVVVPYAMDAYLGMLEGGAEESAFLEVRRRTSSGMMATEFHSVGDHESVSVSVLQHARRTDVYVGCAPRARRAGTKDAIDQVWTLWAECDGAGSVEALQHFTPAPALIIGSGSGVNCHAYWPLTEPLTPRAAESSNLRLAVAIGADVACFDASRILRPPGTWNHKHRPPTRVATVRLERDQRFAVGEVLRSVPEVNEERIEHRWRPQPQRTNSGDPLLQIDPSFYVADLTGRAPGRNRKVACPFHEDVRPSLHVFATPERGWCCFSCGRGGSIYDLAAAMWDIAPRGREFVRLRALLTERFRGELRLARQPHGLERA